jgi:group I intron endonuclease
MTDRAYLYSIENKVNGKCYIGSTVNLKSRWAAHRTTLRHGKHHSFILQRAWDKHGENNFEFKILFICEPKDKIDYENKLIKYQSYNILRTARETPIRRDWVRTTEICKKISNGLQKVCKTPEHRAKLRAARLGYKQTQEAIQKSAIAKWKPVYCKELEVSFLNQKFAAEYLNTSKANVSQLICKKGKVGGKYTLVRVA